MKNKFVLVAFISLILLGVFLICDKSSDKVTLDEVRLKDVEEDNGMFAIMVQEEADSDNYILYDKNTWPTSGYAFNKEKSGCLDSDGKKIESVTLSYANSKVTVETGNTSYCYIYFDKKEPHSYEDLYVDDETLLGDKEKGNDGYLIYHDGTGDYGDYEAGDYSYRFAGNNPDNYVCLDGNPNATGSCDIKKLYRVIGWFQNEDTSQYQMKLIKSEYITTEELGGDLESGALKKGYYNDFTPRADVTNAYGFPWSGDRSINWNNWKSSKLNTTLNNPSGKYLQSLSAYTDANLIEDTSWYIGGNTEDNIQYQTNMKDAYDYELGENKLDTSSSSCVNNRSEVQCTEDLLYQENKVGLMYVTEYGYASAPSNWSKQLYYYSEAKNRSVNWLYNGVYEWTMSRQSDAWISMAYAFNVLDNGDINDFDVNNYKFGVRPVIVFKSEATIKSGDGSKNSPWRINLQNS